MNRAKAKMVSPSIAASTAWNFSLMDKDGGVWRFIGTPNGRAIRSRTNIWASNTAGYFCAGLVSARKTRSSTAIVRVKRVGTAALETATACAELESAGPAGLVCSEFVSPGTTEMRVVAGVQDPVAPKQVSRTKICR